VERKDGYRGPEPAMGTEDAAASAWVPSGALDPRKGSLSQPGGISPKSRLPRSVQSIQTLSEQGLVDSHGVVGHWAALSAALGGS